MSISASLIYSARFTAFAEKKALQAAKKTEFHTHTTSFAEKIHRISETLLLPGRLCAQLLARAVQPLPGQDKERVLWGMAVRVLCVALSILTTPLAIGSFMIALPLRLLDHAYRPVISYIDNSSRVRIPCPLQLSQDHPLHIRTHNLGFVTSSMSIVGDLRPPIQRAKELASSIRNDPNQPDVILFQEAFHEDASRILCEEIKREYPFIIHSVAPHISGFSSGAMVASKYPIESVSFHSLPHMLGPERASQRGVLSVRLESAAGPIFLYNAHTQALLGEDRAQARRQQLEEMRTIMLRDLQNEPSCMQILIGDLNTSRVTAWGEDNLEPKGQAEEAVLNRLKEYFDDVYLRDHDPLTGQRSASAPVYLAKDNERMGEDLVEPSGSWYHGPMADPGLILSSKMRYDRWRHHRPAPQKVQEISVNKSTWGTKKWHKEQTANTARFDYVLLLRNQNKLDGRAEIRRIAVPQGIPSAPTDHLPVDGRFWINYCSS
jgi:endonuclease/exonuclease/phosphatase family metal-dependent hydrolase